MSTYTRNKNVKTHSPKSRGKQARNAQVQDTALDGATALVEMSPEEEAHREENGVLVLNHNFEPLNICAARRGLSLMVLERAEVIRFSHRTLRSGSEEHPVPSVLRLHQQVKRPLPRLKISRKSVMARDGYMCVYCGSKQTLTIDHVFPRHRGGETTWENVVCCCLKCNNKKGARTPSEAGMRMGTPPRKPHFTPYISFPRFVSAVRRPEWREFLEGYGKGLER
jgi:5-methylcytosine-specific restriction endonuclease McrA